MSEAIQKELPEVAGQIDEFLRELTLKIISEEAARVVFDMGDSDLEDHFARLTLGMA
jgi:hypothetical protein